MAHRFLITDPCYVMAGEMWKAFVRRNPPSKGGYEGLPFKTAAALSTGAEKVTLHVIRGTPNGDGSWDRRVKQADGKTRIDEVLVDSGMLCVVEHPTGWPETDPDTDLTMSYAGARYHTLRAAMAAFPGVLRRF